MADSPKPTENPRTKEVQSEKADPTIKTEGVVAEYPEGTHPLHPLKDQDYAAVNKQYGEMSDKPDESSVAQVELVGDEKS